jgi:glycosyltransferase involved in cell wall biosynthesis
MQRPNVLIVVPCYHSEKYIARCCDSISAQTYTNWDAVFVVDDPTYDDTVKLIDDYHNCKFAVSINVNRTTCASARNRGYHVFLYSDYVVFLDSDDWMEPLRLQRQVQYMEMHPDVEWVSSLVHFKDSVIDNKPGSSANPSGITSVMFQRKFLERIKQRDGYLFKTDMRRYDDYDLVMRMRNVESGHILEPLTTLFDNPEGLSRTQHPFWGNWDLYKCVVRNRQWDIFLPWTIAMARSVFIRGWE